MAIAAPIILLFLSLLWTKNQIGKKEGFLLVFIYLLYLVYLIMLELA